MNRYRWLLLPILLMLGSQAMADDDVRILVQAMPSQDSPGSASPFLANQTLNFPADVDFKLEPLYRNNQAKAKIDVLYSCVDAQSGARVVPCHIIIDPPVARENSGGHYPGHLAGRPTGRHDPSTGWVSETDGYLRSTYFASEIGGVVDSIIHCSTGSRLCRDGKVAFGVGVQGLENLGAGTGYVLTGAKTPHPSNHWGVPAFLAAVRTVAAQFASDYPNNPLSYNDVSLEYGGVFDVETPRATGYDWTPPHQTHRLGTNMDIGVPRGNAARALALRLYQKASVRVYQEDAFHWHLIY